MPTMLMCPSCSADLPPTNDGRLPPWCPKCGVSMKQESPETGSEEKQPDAVVPLPAAPRNHRRKGTKSRLCPKCNSNLGLAPGEPMPPWCRTCGENLPKVPPGATGGLCEPDATGGLSGNGATGGHSDLAPTESLEQIRYEPTSYADDDLAAIQAERLNGEFREKFSRHNILVGLLLGIWSVCALTLQDTTTADAKVLEAEVQLNSMLSALQVVTFLTGSLLLVSGIGIARRESWGYLFAGICAAAAIIGGLVFLGGLIHLRNQANSLESAVAVVTYVRGNIDLLIGLVDGGALLVFLYRYSQLPGVADEGFANFEDDRDGWQRAW